MIRSVVLICASNAFFATKVSSINTIADIVQQIPGVDVAIVAEVNRSKGVAVNV